MALNIGDVDVGAGAVVIERGKGGKRSIAFVGTHTLRALDRYLRTREVTPSDPLFATEDGRRLQYWGLQQIIRRRAQYAGVPAPSLHAFRRSFALLSLRNGMDIFALQKLTGHADLTVLRRYLAQTREGLQSAHERAGPVDRLL